MLLKEAKDRKLFNKKSGVYFLKKDNEIIYIGQSKNIGQRLNSHNRANIQTILQQIESECGDCNRTKQLALYLYINRYHDDITFEVEECQIEELNDLEKKIYCFSYAKI